MGRSYSFAIAAALVVTMAPSLQFGPPLAALAPAFAEDFTADQSEYPVRIGIPSIRLDTSVVPVGINAAGEIDVPGGATAHVGWYRYGKLPGDRGNAIFDAHVFAAFKDLRYARIGDEIAVTDGQGVLRRFRITDSRVYAVNEVPMERIVLDESARNLVLITCAREFLPALGTYSHRLVVTATLIE